MKLISLNVEGSTHSEKVQKFLNREEPDVVCLQEAQNDLKLFLEESGYFVYFLPTTIRQNDGEANKPEGLIFASRTAFESAAHYYYRPKDGQLRIFEKEHWRDTAANAVLLSTLTHQEVEYTIATTHFTWTPDGQIAGAEQKEDMSAFLELISTFPSHVICGDFNIPRGFNPLYANLTDRYTDNIPPHYTSSLDKDTHRHGNEPDKSILFTSYMVDYVFTQPPYAAHDVRLEFGVSDHAAVVATIQQ